MCCGREVGLGGGGGEGWGVEGRLDKGRRYMGVEGEGGRGWEGGECGGELEGRGEGRMG